MITVLIADDQALIRQAVAGILETHPEISVAGQAATGLEAVSRARELRPDLVLMDIRMPELDGIGATRRICAEPGLQDTKVLILTTFEEDDNVVAALRAGASGFLGKGSDPDAIAGAIISVHAGESLLSPAATRGLIRRYLRAETQPTQANPQAVAALMPLTERESEVLLQVARGLSNADIAERLFISPHTAKTHVNRIMTKTHSHDRAQLVILAYESGLMAAGEQRGDE